MARKSVVARKSVIEKTNDYSWDCICIMYNLTIDSMRCTMYVCIHVCMYVCMYVCMHVCIHVCIHVCMYVYMYVCMYVCIHVCMYVYMYVCMYTCMYVCIHVFVCTLLHVTFPSLSLSLLPLSPLLQIPVVLSLTVSLGVGVVGTRTRRGELRKWVWSHLPFRTI